MYTEEVGSRRNRARTYGIQYAATLSSGINYFMSGAQDGWSGPSLSKLNISEEDGSWLASAMFLGQILGPILAAIGGLKLGPRKTILCTVLPNFAGALMLAVSESIPILCAGRFLCGLATEAALTITAMYIGQISSPHIRGKLSYLTMLEYNMGLLWVYTLGGFASVRVNGLSLAVFPILLGATFWWMPESAYYSVLKGKDSVAVQTLHLLRITNDTTQDLENIKASIDKENMNKGRLRTLIFNRTCRRALIICFIITNTNIFTGINILLAYAQPIFDQTNSGLSSTVSSIIFVTTGIFTIAFSSFLIDSWGRRPLLILSTTATAFPLIALGGYFYLNHINYDNMSSLDFLPVTGFVLVKFFMSLGVSSLWMVCRSEFFPSNLSALAACILETYSCAMRFVIVKSYQIFADAFGVHTVFLTFGCACVVSAVLVWLFVPETKNQTLDAVQNDLNTTGYFVPQCGRKKK